MNLHPSYLSPLTLRILADDGLHVFDCEQCGESKIGPVSMRICRTCNPVARVKPLAKRRKQPGVCGYGHTIAGANATRKRGQNFDICVECRRRHERSYYDRKRQREERKRCSYEAEATI